MANDLDEVTEHLAGIRRALDMIAMRAAKDLYEHTPTPKEGTGWEPMWRDIRTRWLNGLPQNPRD